MSAQKTDYDTKRLCSAAELAAFVRGELATSQPRQGDIIRVITHEIDRWAKSGATQEELRTLTSEHWSTNNIKWDALIEGIVLHQYHSQSWQDIPSWCYRSRIADPWFVFEYILHSDDAYLESFMTTPADILEKGVIFSSRNLTRL